MPPAPVRIVRDLRLDLFRGLALLLIFLDHIPSNVVSWITVRNYGFSDATEIFIFISGYANAYVYGAVIRRRGLIDAATWILNRAWQIYLAQIFLFVVYIAEIAYLAGSSSYYTDIIPKRRICGFFSSNPMWRCSRRCCSSSGR
jgi:hypothetical protein